MLCFQFFFGWPTVLLEKGFQSNGHGNCAAITKRKSLVVFHLSELFFWHSCGQQHCVVCCCQHWNDWLSPEIRHEAWTSRRVNMVSSSPSQTEAEGKFHRVLFDFDAQPERNTESNERPFSGLGAGDKREPRLAPTQRLARGENTGCPMCLLGCTCADFPPFPAIKSYNPPGKRCQSILTGDTRPVDPSAGL